MYKQLLWNVMPIIEKAAPSIASRIGGYRTHIVIGLIASIIGCDPYDKEKLVQKLEKDEDLFSKLKNLETTHALWLNDLD